jgi:hypothetical protein
MNLGKPIARPSRRRVPPARLRRTNPNQDLLALVRRGVERFILQNTSVEDFFKTIRQVTEKEHTYAHQLTKEVFAKIVRDAIRKRNLKRPK